MRELEIGIRIDEHEGLHFFGADEINHLIEAGNRVISIEPGGALMRKIGADGDNVQLTLTGFSLKVKFEAD